MKKQILIVLLVSLLSLLGLVPGAAPVMAAGPSTSVTVTKYASDNTTVLAQETVDYEWMEDNLTVYGDGSTHYYHQGPTFNATDMWDLSETVNVDSRDYGAAEGTDIRDLLDLVGGAPAGSEIEVKATDNFNKRFSAEDIENLGDADIIMVIAWYNATYGGYVPDYDTGMRLIFFDMNDTDKHVFGNWDMHETIAEEHWHYYYDSGTYWPSSSGLSVQNVDRINIYTDEEPPVPMDILYDGTVNLTPGTTFNVTAYNSGTPYTVNCTTPLGALDAAATAAVFTYDVTDKRYAADGVLLLDNAGGYDRKSPGYWYAYVNDVYKDGFTVTADALNLFEVVNGDHVEYYYAVGVSDPSDLSAVEAIATAAVKTVVSTSPPMDVLYDGTVTLLPGDTFEVTCYTANASGTTYSVNQTTPLGALDATGLSYVANDKKMASKGIILLDDVDTYTYNNPGKWYAYVNDAYKDGFTVTSDALNLFEVVNGDHVDYYYAAGVSDPSDLSAVEAIATAAVKTVVYTGIAPSDWTLQLSGAREESVTRSYFEEGLACPSSGHQVFWKDSDNNTWGGVPLWLLVGMVDDDPDVGPYHFNFNDDLADQHYKVNVIASDGWSATLDSADIARNDGYILANTLNGDPLPLLTQSGKPCWPLYLKGSAVFGGQQVGGVVQITLTDMPAPPSGWTLQMLGDIGDTITQAEFEAALACPSSPHYREWTDIDGNVWSGVPLWVLVGTVDDIETGSHWTFNDDVASENYTIKVIASDNFTKSFSSLAVARSDNYIVANECNGDPLTDKWPLRLVGPGVTKADGSLGGSAVGSIVKIEIPELQTPPAAPGSWNLALTGKITDVISQAEFEAALACPTANHYVEWTDIDGNVWSGMPLWYLAGWVDDRQPHAYNFNQAMAGYTVLVKAGDGYTKDFASADVAKSNDYIIANMYNGDPLADSWPLRLVGPGVTRPDGSLSGASVGNIVEIELTDFQTAQAVPQLHIVKYEADGTTVLDETTVDYTWMQDNLDVVGDGTTVYRYEGITNDPDDIWDAAETYPGGYKIENAVKGTRIRDLCDLVGGMGSGTEIKLIASDGYETTLPYSSVYTNPAVQARQGDAILAWWGDGEYVPYYADGMRLFFMPDGDHVYGQWDMHETLPDNYWHYYYDSTAHVMYPSCAGLSSKWITTINIFSVPEGDWTLSLDGTELGGLHYDVSKTYFEQALACQFGSNHKATYTDGGGNSWEGMPLWFLAGFVDDADQHSDNAFNDALAQAGYRVVITASDGHSVTLRSQDVARSNNYIVANSLNGAHIPDTDADWPLRLVGAGATGPWSISRITSIELKKLVPATSGGGGGGGGGGGSSGWTSLSEYTTGEGKFTSDATAESTNGMVKLEIPKGTVAKNKYGQRLTSISIKEQAAPAEPPDNCNFVCLTYDIGPSGATFDPPINLILKYDEAMIPAGVNEGDLVIATWIDGEWVELEGCVVDPVNNTITVPITHLSVYTTMAHTSPAEFGLTGLTITPSKILPGATLTISVTVTNSGDLTGDYTVTLKINDATYESRVVTLKGGESQMVAFTVTPETAGEFVIDVNGLSGRYAVAEPLSEGKVAEVNPPETTSPPATVTPPAIKPAPTAQPEVTEAPVQSMPSSATSWWLIVVYVFAAIIVISLVAYVYVQRRRD
jgi:DMSO/TMAO reductase YedYZ molybdopterin-dependent catalytic subunit